MNERIKELARQTDIWCDQNHLTDEFYVLRWEEKFAELIVQECMLAVSKTPVSDNEVSIMVRCHEQIEKHFGVEE